MGGIYIQAGDYLIPDSRIPVEEENELVGLWGQRQARHLQEQHKVLYHSLVLYNIKVKIGSLRSMNTISSGNKN